MSVVVVNNELVVMLSPREDVAPVRQVIRDHRQPVPLGNKQHTIITYITYTVKPVLAITSKIQATLPFSHKKFLYRIKLQLKISSHTVSN